MKIRPEKKAARREFWHRWKAAQVRLESYRRSVREDQFRIFSGGISGPVFHSGPC